MFNSLRKFNHLPLNYSHIIYTIQSTFQHSSPFPISCFSANRQQSTGRKCSRRPLMELRDRWEVLTTTVDGASGEIILRKQLCSVQTSEIILRKQLCSVQTCTIQLKQTLMHNVCAKTDMCFYKLI